MVDSSDIDAALVAKLGSDATLLALCPNGVYVDEAPQDSTRFVIVSLVSEVDEPVFGKRGFEDALYLIEARMLSTAGGNIKAAAARIDVLLEDQPLVAPGSPVAPVAGYAWMTTYRESRVRATEIDQINPSIRWLRRGGNYRVLMSVT
jgi:hypothetical protein